LATAHGTKPYLKVKWPYEVIHMDNYVADSLNGSIFFLKFA